MNYAKLARGNSDGLSWYDDAIADVRYVCEREQWEEDRFTSVLALTSPRCSVVRNVRNTFAYLRTGSLLENTISGVRLSVAHWERGQGIKGPKTAAFYAALRGDVNSVVLDVHMANLFGVPQASFSSKRGREPWQQLVRETAAECGFTPRDTQACLWYGQRRRVGERPSGFSIAREYANWLAHDRSFPVSGSIYQWADRSGHYQPFLWSE